MLFVQHVHVVFGTVIGFDDICAIKSASNIEYTACISFKGFDLTFLVHRIFCV